jgi:hypothetical protein
MGLSGSIIGLAILCVAGVVGYALVVAKSAGKKSVENKALEKENEILEKQRDTPKRDASRSLRDGSF